VTLVLMLNTRLPGAGRAEEMTMREIHKWLRQLLMILYERTETLNLNLFRDVQPSEIDESVV